MGADLHEYAEALRLAALAARDADLAGIAAIGVCPVEGHPDHAVRVVKYGGVWTAVLERDDLDGELEAIPPSVLVAAGLEYLSMVDFRGPEGIGEFRTGFAWPVG